MNQDRNQDKNQDMNRDRQRRIRAVGVGTGLLAIMTAVSVAGSSAEAAVSFGWEEENGVKYWYENGVRQGTDGRGKEIYDPSSDAWYWLDSVQGGAMTTNKDVYQESSAGIFAENRDGTGKWVRYDENGHMVKGWQTNENGTYYFDLVYGTMAKGYCEIDGQLYFFDFHTGIGDMRDWEDADGWVVMGDVKYWYENGVRQGTSGRGKEIYDPASDAWYWLDAVSDGKMAVSKDVYQESAAGAWAENKTNGTGKWVRYDENGCMVKGWSTNEKGTFYFDPVYGTMAKGMVEIDGKSYEFAADTGILRSSVQQGDVETDWSDKLD